MLTTEPTETNMDNIPAASDQQVLVVVAIVIWENVSGNAIRYRTEPDMEKKADKSIGVGETVAGVIEGDWLKTADGLYLPAQHPVTGVALFTAAALEPSIEASTVAAPSSWENVSGNATQYQTEPDMEKKADKSIGVGETVAGVIEGEWLNTADGLYLPAQHPDRGQALPSHSAAVFGRRLLQRWCRRCLIGLACKFLFWIVIFAIISAMSPPKCCDETCEKCTES